ncbi:hypothetical protein IAG25_05110 [Caballeronia sp. EK]|uniref:hypothetical protein n=1 Tax=Caballeronia sp. EK TaxID=2767469 RepID=UPI001656087A|nr:hypothetical protein [Caballeronia sp. EK]MBC8636180.1 hypothetical protein [Caballeronia sp. EK]
MDPLAVLRLLGGAHVSKSSTVTLRRTTKYIDSLSIGRVFARRPGIRRCNRRLRIAPHSELLDDLEAIR